MKYNIKSLEHKYDIKVSAIFINTKENYNYNNSID